MHRPCVLGLLALPLLAACDPPPFKEGTWHLSYDAITNSTCPYDLSPPAAGRHELALSDDGDLLVGPADWPAVFELDGAAFHASDTLREHVRGGCYLRTDAELDGEFVSRTFAEVEVLQEISVEGDCSGADTTGLPCALVVVGSWSYVGE